MIEVYASSFFFSTQLSTILPSAASLRPRGGLQTVETKQHLFFDFCVVSLVPDSERDLRHMGVNLASFH